MPIACTKAHIIKWLYWHLNSQHYTCTFVLVYSASKYYCGTVKYEPRELTIFWHWGPVSSYVWSADYLKPKWLVPVETTHSEDCEAVSDIISVLNGIQGKLVVAEIECE